MTAFYDLTTFNLGLTDAASAAASVNTRLEPEVHAGAVVFFLRPEFGGLNRLILLRRFESADALLEDRRSIANHPAPSPWGADIAGWRSEIYESFPDFPEPPQGDFGPLYELRTYGTKPGYLRTLMKQWADARVARASHSPFLLAMHSLDRPARIMHLWGYASLEDRARARREASTTGWPPPIGFEALEPSDMQSTLCLPVEMSPLR